MYNLVSCEQYTRERLEKLYELTDQIAANPAAYADKLKGKIIATLFFEPSTRTRFSFESAALRLGAGVISTENGNAGSSTAKGETLEDTIRVVMGYCDAIIIRHSEDDSSERAAAVSSVPIINAGAGSGEHPTQALLDLYTIRAKRGSLDGLKVAVMGDLRHGRTIHSLLKLLSLYDGLTVYGLSRELFQLTPKYVKFLKDKGIKYIVCKDFSDIPKDVDVLYHTRTQAERFDKSFSERVWDAVHGAPQSSEQFVVNKKILSKFSEQTMLLHPLPRNEEIDTNVDNDPRALFFEQAHNGIPVRMAVLLTAIS